MLAINAIWITYHREASSPGPSTIDIARNIRSHLKVSVLAGQCQTSNCEEEAAIPELHKNYSVALSLFHLHVETAIAPLASPCEHEHSAIRMPAAVRISFSSSKAIFNFRAIFISGPFVLRRQATLRVPQLAVQSDLIRATRSS